MPVTEEMRNAGADAAAPGVEGKRNVAALEAVACQSGTGHVHINTTLTSVMISRFKTT